MTHRTSPARTPLGFIIVTHGDMGRELLRVARYIMGERLQRFKVVSIPFMAEVRGKLKKSSRPFQDRRDLIESEIRTAMAAADTGAGVVILADIVGGTSFTVARELLAEANSALVSGVNLPMLLKAASIEHLSPQEAAAQLVERSRAAIMTDS